MNFNNVPPSASESRPSSSPRWVCRVARQWCAVMGEGRSRHVATCADCQAYFRATAELDRALRHAAGERSRETAIGSDTLERDILRAVRESAAQRGAERSSGWRGGWWIGGVAAAAAVAVAFTVITRERPLGERVVRVDPNEASTDAEVLVSTVGSLSDQLVDSVIPSAGEIVATNPLQKEIGSVYSDMRSALNFLAMNFLPANSAPKPSRSSG